MSVCLIPARGGSKRIPRKNLRDFCGKPMIQWSIEAAQAADCFERIIVSTDDGEIAEIAEKLGAEVPFVRPEKLSGDHATTIEVICHALDWLEAEKSLPGALCCLYATAPFARPQDIRAGLKALKNAQYVVPVTTFSYPIQRALRMAEDGTLTMLDRDLYRTRSQDLEEVWHDAGQFYWATSGAWRSDRGPYAEKTAALKLPRHLVQDIDTPEDWARAEALFKASQGA